MIAKTAQLRLSLGSVALKPSLAPFSRMVAAMLLSMFALLAGSPVQATPLIEFGSQEIPNFALPAGQFVTFGYEFTVSTGATVAFDAFGVYNLTSTLSQNHDVAIWDANGNRLVGGTVTTKPAFIEPSMGIDNVGSYFYDYIPEDVSPYILTGGTYVLGAYYGQANSDFVVVDATSFIEVDGVQYQQGRSHFGDGISFPEEESGLGNRWFGPTLHMAMAIPEPTTPTLLAISLTVLWIGRRIAH